MSTPGVDTAYRSGICGETRPSVLVKSGVTPWPGGGTVASTDHTSPIDWFQNSIDQNAFDPCSDLPMNSVRARPVSRSIQSGGVGSVLRNVFAIEFDAFAAAISPVRFQANTSAPTAPASPSAPGGKPRAPGRRRRASDAIPAATVNARTPNSSRFRSLLVKYHVRFSHSRIARPNASEYRCSYAWYGVVSIR